MHTRRRFGRRVRLGFLAAALWYAASAAIGAHAVTTGFVTFMSGHPVTGRTGEMRVELRGLTGAPVSLRGAKLTILADMTGHAMTPVVADLSRELPGYVRAGDIKFTMPGEWRITLRLEEPKEAPKTAVFPLTVLRYDAVVSNQPFSVPVSLEAIARPTVFDPWMVLLLAVGLVLLFEAVAVAGYLKRQARTSEATSPEAV